MSLLLALFSVTCIHPKSSSLQDTIPPCITHIKTETGKRITKYEYKGQYWFAFQSSLKVVDNNSDKMTTITFYDSTCRVVARWTKGGIAGLNKVTPDTVDKKNIIPLWAEKDTVSKQIADYKKYSLPDTIQKMAILKKAKWIQQSDCAGKIYYNFQLLSTTNTGSTISFENMNYNGQAKPQAKIPFGKLSWWRVNDSNPVTFTHTPFRPGYR
jgi:hypothetical protein